MATARKTNPAGRQVARIGYSSNVFVIRAVGHSRTIAHNEAKVHRLLSTLIWPAPLKGRGLAISNEEQIRCVTIVCMLWHRVPLKLERR